MGVAEALAPLVIARTVEDQRTVTICATRFVELVRILPSVQELAQPELDLVAETGLAGKHLANPRVG
ncbi:MAG: hypothetical protein AB7L09_03495 [Nitrospira sp.]